MLAPVLGEFQGKKDPKTGEINTPAAKGERKTTALRSGDMAPDFTLPDLKKTKDMKLSSYQGKKPVVLIFGSYT
jgi:peroxiredoxin